MISTMRMSALSLILFSLIILCSSCEEDEGSPADQNGTPWKEQIMMGNFSINSGTITTNEDGISTDGLDDYVMESALPQVNFELMGIQAWVPTEEGMLTSVSNTRVRMATETGMRTGNIFHDGFSYFKERVQYGGTTYAVYEVFGFYDHSLGAINPSNFANVSFELEVDYKKNNKVIGSRMITLGVYKRK